MSEVPTGGRDGGGLRDAVAAAVGGFAARTPREVGSRAAILDALDRLPEPFSRDADPTHVTGSAIVTGSRGTVLHMHKRLHRWLQPGGHLDRGETPWDAALRESREELGMEVAHPASGPVLIHVDVHAAALGHVHLDLRYLLVARGDTAPAPPPGESAQARWFTWDGARAVADDGLADALGRAQAWLGDGSPEH